MIKKMLTLSLILLLGGCATLHKRRIAAGYAKGISDYQKLKEGKKISAYKQGYLIGVGLHLGVDLVNKSLEEVNAELKKLNAWQD